MAHLSILIRVSIVFCALMLFLLPNARADDLVVSGFTVTGLRSTSEDYTDEDEANDYEFINYSLRLRHDPSERVSYDISTYFYDKDYTEKNSLDNKSKIVKGSASYVFRESRKDYLKLRIRIKYREKRYDNEPSSEYNQFMTSSDIALKKKERYSINLTAGFDNFNYIRKDVKDQFKLFAKIATTNHLLHKKLKLTASYRIKALIEDKKDRKKIKQDAFGGIDYTFNHPAIYKVMARATWGQHDTKENDVRDVDYDYEYRAFYIKTLHNVYGNVKTDIKYHYYRKDYISADLDHKSFSIRNAWRYIVLNNTANRFTVGLKAEYKNTDYDLKTDNSYKKIFVEMNTTYQKKRAWKSAITLKGDFYDYHNSDKDKNRYSVRVSGDRLFLNQELALSSSFTFRYTDNKHKNDDTNESVKIAFSYSF